MSAGAYDVEGDALRQVRMSTNALVDATPERALGSFRVPKPPSIFSAWCAVERVDRGRASGAAGRADKEASSSLQV